MTYIKSTAIVPSEENVNLRAELALDATTSPRVLSALFGVNPEYSILEPF